MLGRLAARQGHGPHAGFLRPAGHFHYLVDRPGSAVAGRGVADRTAHGTSVRHVQKRKLLPALDLLRGERPEAEKLRGVGAQRYHLPRGARAVDAALHGAILLVRLRLMLFTADEAEHARILIEGIHGRQTSFPRSDMQSGRSRPSTTVASGQLSQNSTRPPPSERGGYWTIICFSRTRHP